MDYKKTLKLITDKRAETLRRAEALFAEALDGNAALYDAETGIRRIELDAVKGSPVDQEALDAFKKQKAAILEELGLTEKMLNPPPSCDKCRDTGLDKSGGYCACVKNNAIQSGENIRLELHDFKDFKYDLQGDTKAAAWNLKTATDLKKIISAYPDTTKHTILLTGDTGTGKTFLMGCLAKNALEKGLSVVFITAFDFVNRMLKYHTTFDENKLSYLQPLLDCEILIIDDLGTESMLKNVTVEYLYTVINERQCFGLTAFSTNLSPEALIARYGDRIYSRLFDKRTGYANSLCGEDLRLKKIDKA